jgi:hypothetical protein
VKDKILEKINVRRELFKDEERATGIDWEPLTIN